MKSKGHGVEGNRLQLAARKVGILLTTHPVFVISRRLSRQMKNYTPWGRKLSWRVLKAVL